MACTVEFLRRNKILSLCVWLKDECRMTQLFIWFRTMWNDRQSDFAFVNVIKLCRWCPGSGKENISKWEPLGLSACLLVAYTGRMVYSLGSGNSFPACIDLSLVLSLFISLSAYMFVTQFSILPSEITISPSSQLDILYHSLLSATPYWSKVERKISSKGQ